jgi:Glyoxalase-like domain
LNNSNYRDVVIRGDQPDRRSPRGFIDLGKLGEQSAVHHDLPLIARPANNSRVTIQWVYAFLDRPADGFDAAADFWTTVLKWSLSPRRGEHDEFATLVPPDGDAYVKVQAVREGGGMHLDLAVSEVRVLADRAGELGAQVVADQGGYIVLASPGGQLFCAVPWHGEARRPQPTRSLLGATSRLDQAVIDVTPARVDDEVTFWIALTGWPAYERGEFTVVQQPDDLPVRLLIQRIGEGRPTAGHVDLACSDRTLVRAWHEKNGATVVAEHPLWTVMRDPAGGVYCLTSRDPTTGRLP